MVFRFANILLEPIWNNHYIDHVQITHSETLGIEGRADYYEGAGALRDMIQSHLMQLLALVAMEPPVTLSAEHLRDEKVKVLKAYTAHHTKLGARPCISRSIYQRHHQWQARSGVCGRTRRGAGQRHGNLCGTKAVYRQLALGWSAVLSAHRQTYGGKHFGNLYPLQKPASGFAASHTSRVIASELDHAGHSAQ